MTQAKKGGVLERGHAQQLQNKRQLVLELPAPGDDWATADTPLSRQDVQTLHQLDAITHDGWEYVYPERDDGGRYDRKRWRTVPEVYDWAQANLTESAECPAEGCHATGIHNPADAAGYRCNNPECDEPLTEAQARELIR